MTPQQFFEWQRYAEAEPFGEARDDWRFAQLGALLANLNRDSKKHPQPFEIKDFLLKFESETERPKRKQTWQETKRIVQLLVAASNQKAK